MRKRQVDKADKTKADYEFEKQGQECTFAPKLMSKNPRYIRDRIEKKIESDGKATPLQVNSSQDLLASQPKAEAPSPQTQFRPMTAKERQDKFEQKQLERLKKAREEKERK